MSRLHLWAPWLLFIWQLLWLQVQAAQPPEVTLAHLESVQTQQLILSTVPVSAVSTQQSGSSQIMTGKTASKDVCDLCTSSNRTLSCTGLSPEQKLRSVPVPQPSLYASTIIVLILSNNPLTAIEDPYLFNLPELKYLDLGTTEVSLTTVSNILKMCLELEKLILPRHLACCLCQLKKNLEAVTETVKLCCDTGCPANAPCDKNAIEGRLLKVLSGRKNSTQLTVQPGKATAGEKEEEGSAALKSFLMKMLSEHQEVKISKAKWDEEQWKEKPEKKQERTEEWTEERPEERPEETPVERPVERPMKMESHDEPKVQVTYEIVNEEPEQEHINKFRVASPVIVVMALFSVILFPFDFYRKKRKEGGLWRRLLLWLKRMFESLAAYIGTKVENADAESAAKSEGSGSASAKTYAGESAAEGAEENE